MKSCRNCGTVMIHGTHYESGGHGDFYKCPRCHDRFDGRVFKDKDQDNLKKRYKRKQ